MDNGQEVCLSFVLSPSSTEVWCCLRNQISDISREINMKSATSRKRGSTNKDIGNLGERIATIFLESKGFVLIERNFTKPWGEIDIICEKDDTIRFIEVKSMTVNDFSRERSYEPEALVNHRKLKKVARTASLYMESRRDRREYQIDVVGVLLNKKKRQARCRLIEQALESD